VVDDFIEVSISQVGLSPSTISKIQAYLKNRWRLRITISDIFKLTLKRMFWFLNVDSKSAKEKGLLTF